ncbi:MAG TPA: hypothetical protein VFW03_23210 [Gemmatimonadaceae bacterium]|nr:hypothetical protein [Gemmatimonadaceae bacterium]
MSQTFPFTRAKSIGWAFGEIFTSAQANTMDANAAQAADGLVWSDFAQLRNWRTGSVTNITTTAACAWDATKYCWFVAGYNGTTPEAGAALASGNGNDIALGGAVDAGAGLVCGPEAACVAPDGSWLFGGAPGSSSQQKIRRSTDTGANWAAQNTVATGTTGVNLLHTFAGLAIAGLANGNIETSPNGTLWTNRTVPNANARGSVASSASIVVIASPTVTTNKVITSGDGITWTERTMPSSLKWRVAYSAVDGKFIATSESSIAWSTDGITWSTSGVTVPSFQANTGARGGIVVLNRAWIVHDGFNFGTIFGSIDAGATWRPLAILGGADTFCWRVGDRAILAVGNDGVGNTYSQTLSLGGR